MKNILSLFICAFIIFSCSSDDSRIEEGTGDCNDSCVIAEYHTLNRSGSIRAKFIFDTNGRIEHLVSNSREEKYYFEFDSENRLINITTTDLDDVFIESQDIIYDGLNRVTQIGERLFEYVEADPSYYIETNSFSQQGPFTDGDIEYYDNYITRYYNSRHAINPMVSGCSYWYRECTNTTTGETSICDGQYCGDSVGYGYNGINVEDVCTDDCFTYLHDNNTNPLSKYNNTNLIEVYGFLKSAIDIDNRSHSYTFHTLYSQNNMYYWYICWDGCDDYYNLYTYSYNEYELPVSVFYQWYEEGLVDEYPFANYYYQGDEIPE